MAMIVAFIQGSLRHDFVAALALLACVALGLVVPEDAFAGFGHPAVITVAAILILSGMLQTTGAADRLVRFAIPSKAGPFMTQALLVIVAALLSAFMNNVGALALLMPVALQLAARHNIPAGKLLMPLSFGSILGGMTTLIGTPPNLIVAGFRAKVSGEAFSMFDFSPVGVVVALAGVLFILLTSRFLVPLRSRAGIEGFETGAYIAEARVTEKSKLASKNIRDIEAEIDKAGLDVQIIGLVRNEKRLFTPHRFHQVNAGDILIVEAGPEELTGLLESFGLQIIGDKNREDVDTKENVDAPAAPANILQSDDIILMEVALLPESALQNRSVTDIYLNRRYDINLLAVSRQGERRLARLKKMKLAAGDVLLLQGEREALAEFSQQYSCVPLADRPLRLPSPQPAMLAVLIMGAAVLGTVLGAPATLCFVTAAIAAALLKIIPARSFYNSVDWSVIVLLGALIPVAHAFESTGAAAMMAGFFLDNIAQNSAIITLIVLLVVTMTLSDFMNNVATAAIMCPIAISAAQSLGVNTDPFLMAVAIGASCAFLTPIGHQNNTLILGPGGFRFGDYWRLGLPLEVLVIAVSIPMLLIIWPL
jgi:di/tricarboxylate transporter